jgi:SAM-dependent methyltransferase
MEEKREISDWWSKNPMTYGIDHGTTKYETQGHALETSLGSREFFENADRQLYEWNRPLHDDTGPFGRIFPYAEYRGRPVLEIGCGMGGMAMLWASRGALVTAVDLNPTAVEQTRRRFELFGFRGRIQQEDANRLAFADASFDYAYSWGVLHHSPDLERSLAEVFRVLRPGGGFGVMLYNRHSLLHAYLTLYVEGFLHGESRFLSPLALASRYGDGARQEGNPYTWPVTRAELTRLVAPHAADFGIRTLGTDLDYSLHLMLPGLSLLVPRIVRKAWARRFGWSLWASGRKVGLDPLGAESLR